MKKKNKAILIFHICMLPISYLFYCIGYISGFISNAYRTGKKNHLDDVINNI